MDVCRRVKMACCGKNIETVFRKRWRCFRQARSVQTASSFVVSKLPAHWGAVRLRSDYNGLGHGRYPQHHAVFRCSFWTGGRKPIFVGEQSTRRSLSRQGQGTCIFRNAWKYRLILLLLLLLQTAWNHETNLYDALSFYWGLNLKVFYTGCNRRNGPDFGRVFLRSNYTDITQNTYIQSWTVTEILAREVWNFDSYYSLTDYQIHIETGRNMWFL